MDHWNNFLHFALFMKSSELILDTEIIKYALKSFSGEVLREEDRGWMLALQHTTNTTES